MKLDELLQVMDRAAANIARLQAIRDRAQPMIPTHLQRGTSREYEDLRRAWTPLLEWPPAIDGMTVTEDLSGIDEAGWSFIELFEMSEPAFELMNELEQPGHQLDEYRFRLGRARRRAIHDRLDELTSTINVTLTWIVESIDADSSTRVDDPRTTVIEESINEIERLLAEQLPADRGTRESVEPDRAAFQRWGRYAEAVIRSEQITGRPAPALFNDASDPRPAPAFVEWLMGLELGWVTVPSWGLSTNQQLAALGNGVQPTQAVSAITSLLSVARRALSSHAVLTQRSSRRAV